VHETCELTVHVEAIGTETGTLTCRSGLSAARLSGLVLLSIFVAGCSVNLLTLPTTAETPEVAAVPSEPTEADIRQRLISHAEALSTFRGQARLEYKGKDKTRRFSQMIAVKDPDRLRIDFMNPFGPSYTVATDGSQLIAFDRGEKILYRGLPSARNVQRYTRAAVDVGVLAALIRGLPPLLPRAAHAEVTRAEDGWHWSAAIKGGGRMTVVLDPEELDVTSVIITGAVLTGDLTASFSDYESVDGVRVAHLVRATLPDGTDVELKYSKIWRKISLNDSAFRLDAPSGVTVVDMEEEWQREESG